MKVTTKRAQMYLPLNLFQELEREAKQEKVSMASLTREAIRSFLARKKKAKDWENDPVWDIVGSARSRYGNLSANHDHYLYGKKKR